MTQHTEACRERCTLHGSEDTELLHEVVERLDRLTAAIETAVAIVGPIIGKRLAKMGVSRAVGKFEAEWRSDERH